MWNAVCASRCSLTWETLGILTHVKFAYRISQVGPIGHADEILHNVHCAPVSATTSTRG